MTLLTWRIPMRLLTGFTLASAMLAGSSAAQAQNEGKPADNKSAPQVTETIYLANATGQNDLNDVQTALRNSLTYAHIYGDASQYAIMIHGTAEDVATAKRLVADLDRPRKTYRVTYTVTESDSGKRTGAQHYSLIVASGGKTTLKQGNRVPLITGMPEGGNATQSSQVQYVDVGLNIDAGVEGVGLRTKVELSAVADEKSGIGVQDPVVRQTMVEGMLNLDLHKPLVLGSIDIPGTTRHQEIEVSVEPLTQ